MRLRQIEIFNAVYDSGSISNAARNLNVAQPTVSKILKHTEDQLGFLLFQRIKGRLVATSEANVLYKETCIIYRQINKLLSTAENLKNPEKATKEQAKEFLPSERIAQSAKCTQPLPLPMK